MIISVIDIETTGLDPIEDRIVEIAAVVANSDDWTAHARASLVNPLRPIPPTASAIHHITDEMVSAAPFLDQVIVDFAGADVYVAHNNRFDMQFLPKWRAPWIDTYRCAIALWPDAPSYSNQVLSYWRKLPRPPASDGHAHRALFDAMTTWEIFRALLNETSSIDHLIEISSKPVLLRKMSFGKHAGTPFDKLPLDYLQWMAKQSFDEDVAHTVKSEIARRSGQVRHGSN